MLNSDNKRVGVYKKDKENEDILLSMNNALEEKFSELLSQDLKPFNPITFIVGAQRTGSTFLNQLLINNYYYTYPTNLISRYWKVPFVGTLLSKTVIEKTEKVSYESDLGFTDGGNAPHEFGYFWKQWCNPVSGGQLLGDVNRLTSQLALMEKEGGSPLLFKNLIHVGRNIGGILNVSPNSLVIYIKRDPFYTIQSTWLSRQKLFNSSKEWFGVYPPNYDEIKKMEPLEQVVAQVLGVEQYLDRVLEEYKKNVIIIKYEDLIADQGAFLLEFDEKSKELGLNLIAREKRDYAPSRNANTVRVSKQEEIEIKRLISKHNG